MTLSIRSPLTPLLLLLAACSAMQAPPDGPESNQQALLPAACLPYGQTRTETFTKTCAFNATACLYSYTTADALPSLTGISHVQISNLTCSNRLTTVSGANPVWGFILGPGETATCTLEELALALADRPAVVNASVTEQETIAFGNTATPGTVVTFQQVNAVASASTCAGAGGAGGGSGGGGAAGGTGGDGGAALAAPVLSSTSAFGTLQRSGSNAGVALSANVTAAAAGAQVVVSSFPAGAIVPYAVQLGWPPVAVTPLSATFHIPAGQTLINLSATFGEYTSPTPASLCVTVSNDVGARSSSRCFDTTIDRRNGIVSISGDVTDVVSYSGIDVSGTTGFGAAIAPGAAVTRTLTFTNNGGHPPIASVVNEVAAGVVTVEAPFTISASTCGAFSPAMLMFSLAPGASCSATVRFSSSVMGSATGAFRAYGRYVNSLSVTMNANVCNVCGGVCRAPPTGVSATRSTTCSSTTLTALGSLSGGFGARFSWYTGACGGTLVGSGTSITVSPAATTTYYVRAEGGLCSPSTCAAYTVTRRVCSGSCSTCNAATGACQASPAACTGNCDQCAGSGDVYDCSANAALCSGTCARCSGSGTSFNCGGNELSCPGSCSACSGSGTSFSGAPAGCSPGDCRSCGIGRIQVCTGGCGWGTCVSGSCP